MGRMWRGNELSKTIFIKYKLDLEKIAIDSTKEKKNYFTHGISSTEGEFNIIQMAIHKILT